LKEFDNPVCLPAGKIMASVFCEAEEVIYVTFMPWGTTINIHTYCNTLK
jgi:hypothetical protein